tara:strand:- start:355 stop:834 length:480 start_codon:yes stop_codon:yes gene_type:complete
MILENFKSGYNVTKGSVLAAGEKNDCAVRAFANAFNITYDVAHSFTAENFKRKARKGTKHVFSTLNTLGKVTFDLFSDSLFPVTKEYKLKCVRKPINKDYTHKPVQYTVKTFCAKFSKGTYIVLVNKHALCVKDGIVIDNPDMRFTGYRRVVESYIKVA